jgi:hypothetical protein
MSDENKSKTARSYSGSILSDNFILHINIRFLLNTFIVFGSIIYSFYSVMSRLESVERELQSASVEIKSLMDKHIADEEVKITEMQQKLEWYETELNLNPLSWGKKKRKKK